MPNMSLKKTTMAEQEPQIRNKNFEEVALGYTLEEAQCEADRCLNCKNQPCVHGCPVDVPIPQFISLIREGKIEQAAEKIKEMNLMPAICGRVCPQEKQCEKYCVRGIKGEPVAIGRLERFAADYLLQHKKDAAAPAVEKNGHRVAVVGSGPSGLTCAGELARKGYDVTIYEALHRAGGVLVYGIPEFRLPKSIVQEEIDSLQNLGVTVRTNYVIGKTETVDELFEDGYEAVFIGSGAGLPSFMNIPGEELNGVYSANEFLTRINLMKAYKPDSATPILPAKNVTVVGGGNVAMDAARCAKRIGANVTIVYRRTENELPARLEEIHHAREEDVEFRFLTSPIEIVGDEDGNVTGLICQQMELSQPDSSGRARPVPIQGSEFTLETDCVIMAIGNTPNPLISRTTKGLDVNQYGCLVLTDSDLWQTTREGVYAGGDAVTGAATVILAMGAGKAAAKSIDDYIQAKTK